MVATREEYAGLPPKKRPARPAASKGGATAPEGGKPAARAASGKEKEREGKAEGAVAAAEKKPAAKEAAGRDEARRTSDSSKGPSLPPGMGVVGRGRREEPAPQRRDERRRDERPGAGNDGPPPGGLTCASHARSKALPAVMHSLPCCMLLAALPLSP